jgi:hypothetical protein
MSQVIVIRRWTRQCTEQGPGADFGVLGDEGVSAGMRLIQPIALAWLSPTPAMAISEMPIGESQGPMEAQL